MNTIEDATTSREQKPKTSQAKLAFFWVVLLVMLGGVVEFAAGWVLRLTHGYDGEHLLQYSFDSYKNIIPTPSYRDTRGVTHNAAGFRRASEVERQKGLGKFRVFLMGGSTAFGTGGLWPHIERRYPVLHDSVTIDHHIERMLKTARPDLDFEVINAAIPSTWTHHSFIYLSQTILLYQPDLVLFLDGFNDFYQCESPHEQFASYTYGERATVIMGDPTLTALIQANGWWLSRRSAAAYLAFRTFQQAGLLLKRTGERPPIDVQQCFAQAKRNLPENALRMWRRSAVLLASEGVDAVFMMQPMLMLERDRPGLTEIERRLLEFDVTSWPEGRESYIRQVVPWASDTARSTIIATGQRFLDLTGIYRDAQEQVFTDYAHLTPRGNELLSRIVVDSILPLVARRVPLRSRRAAEASAASYRP